MNEIYKEPNVEKQKLQKENEQYERYEQWMRDHPEIVIAPENRRESELEIKELEEMLVVFESEHPLAELFLIINLTSKEAPGHLIREPAKNALIPIVARLNILKKETNISLEKYEGLKAKYMHLSRAVGIINNNKVDHNR